MWPVPTVCRRYMVIIRTCPHTIFSSLSDNNLAITQCCCSHKFLFPCLVSRVVNECANESVSHVYTQLALATQGSQILSVDHMYSCNYKYLEKVQLQIQIQIQMLITELYFNYKYKYRICISNTIINTCMYCHVMHAIHACMPYSVNKCYFQNGSCRLSGLSSIISLPN